MKNSQLPSTPIVRNPRIMPCGCEYEEAMMEQWAVGIGLWCHTAESNKIVAMGRHTREDFVQIVRLLTGGGRLTWQKV